MTVRVTAWFVTRRLALAAAAAAAAWPADPGDPRGQPAGDKATCDPSLPSCLAADDASDPSAPTAAQYSYYTRPLSFGRSSSAAGYGLQSTRSTVQDRLSVLASESDRPDANAVVR